jgi:hypothetical protein
MATGDRREPENIQARAGTFSVGYLFQEKIIRGHFSRLLLSPGGTFVQNGPIGGRK